MRHPVNYAPSQDFGENPTSVIYPGHPDYWIIQKFGNYQPDGHTGTDYPCPSGTPVRAAADGTVLHVGWLGGTYADNPWWISPSFAGYVAVIDHGHFIGIYGHCLDGSAGVRKGDRVREGDVFIRSGNTGASTGDHLHFECLPDGYVLNGFMYGRINPQSLFRGVLTPQGSTTTTVEEIIMALTNEDADKIANAILDQRRGSTLGEMVNEYRGQHLQIISAIQGIDTGGTIDPAAIAAAIPEGIAKAVADELSKRLGA